MRCSWKHRCQASVCARRALQQCGLAAAQQEQQERQPARLDVKRVPRCPGLHHVIEAGALARRDAAVAARVHLVAGNQPVGCRRRRWGRRRAVLGRPQHAAAGQSEASPDTCKHAGAGPSPLPPLTNRHQPPLWMVEFRTCPYWQTMQSKAAFQPPLMSAVHRQAVDRVACGGRTSGRAGAVAAASAGRGRQ